MPLFMADAKQIRRLLDNLVFNAAKYSPRGSTIEVRLRCYRDQSDLRRVLRRESPLAPPCALVEVQDQGIGIKRADLEKVFEPFYQGQSGQLGSGFGLGLQVCKGIVEAHGGAIWVENRRRQGSTFRCLFPQKPPWAASPAAGSSGNL
jgi:signal transduction histidine kinase